MKEKNKKVSSIQNKQTKLSAKDERKERKQHSVKDQKTLQTKETESKTLLPAAYSTTGESDLNSNTDSSDVYDNISVHYLDDMDKSEESVMDAKDRQEDLMTDAKESAEEIIGDKKEKDEEEVIPDAAASQTIVTVIGNEKDDGSSDGCKEGESEGETAKDSTSSQEESKNKIERASRVPKNLTKKLSSESCPRSSRGRTDRQGSATLQFKSTQRKSHKGDPIDLENNHKNMKVHAVASSDSSDGSEDSTNEERKELDASDETLNGSQCIEMDKEADDTEENGFNEDKLRTEQKIEEMEEKIDKLEEELREIAALEISLYSVVPEHGSSAHKVHTPARRLSRFYIHACKHWTQNKKASIAKNTVSGLVLIAKSCGTDVARLTFWWSNTVVLREIIIQAFGGARQPHNHGRITELNGGTKTIDGKSPFKWKANGTNKHMKTFGFMQFIDDWQETSTVIAALEKVESWIFSRIVESVWWQTLTPHMQSPVEDMYSEKGYGRLLGPALGDQQQGTFSINLWKGAFQDAFQRLCPVRAGGHECGCLPVLARMVMEQCVARLDVAMFNAILRESAYEIPTDPVSDPIVDSKVLPIPAGDLSFGSGAQLKNSVGNWSRYLMDLFGMDAEDIVREDQVDDGSEDDGRGVDEASKYFYLLNALSDLLMLPKDMLIDRSVRKEVCPTLGVPILKRILCNFTPDEFCPDPVPGSVLEALNSESILERRQSDKDLINSFPCLAAPVVYCPPSLVDVPEKIGEAGQQPELGRNVSLVQRKGYTSDEELDELDSPLTSVIDKTSSPRVNGGSERHTGIEYRSGSSVRYDLLREVWLV